MILGKCEKYRSLRSAIISHNAISQMRAHLTSFSLLHALISRHSVPATKKTRLNMTDFIVKKISEFDENAASWFRGKSLSIPLLKLLSQTQFLKLILPLVVSVIGYYE